MGKTTLKDAEILLIGYAIATDALSCQDYQSVSKTTHACIKYYSINSSIFLNLSSKLPQ
ncbi:hypothetical protein [Tolypothrix sp. NIES-4075]|uniref:hypothetical protein n=1 Tax=Tolypothrix sp. NIES-4075 TaxID=2005459 RepID=UPI001359BDBE|nr:hypothetical protein [Tolypothrix sp. NIES-4075]